MDHRRRWTRLMLFFAATACCWVVLAGCVAGERTDRLEAVITRVVDGDTMKAELDGREETIRLLLIDTPETVDPNRPVQPFGPEASAYAKERLTGERVELELDESDRDKYGRLLVYLWKDGDMFNEQLLQLGLARVAYVYEPNVKHVDRLRDAQEAARDEGIGIWSIEGYVREDGFDPQAGQLPAADAEPPSCDDPQIKGNINSDGEHIYHLPGSPSYEQTKPEAMFCTEEEAQAAGFRAVRR